MTASFKTKQICRDLRTLRQIALHLLRHDSVTFLAYIEGLRLSEGRGCLWLMHDSSHVMYEMARRRVYVFKRGLSAPGGGVGSSGAGVGSSVGGVGSSVGGVGSSGAGVQGPGLAVRGREGQGAQASTTTPQVTTTTTATNHHQGQGSASELHLILEQVPKWDLLRQVLFEIQQERKKWIQNESNANPSPSPLPLSSSSLHPVLVVARQAHMSTQLEQVIYPCGQSRWPIYVVNLGELVMPPPLIMNCPNRWLI